MSAEMAEADSGDVSVLELEAEEAQESPSSRQETLSEQDVYEDDDKQDDVRPGETPEEALQRRIEEGKIGKGKTLRRWKDTEEKQRKVESGRHESKVQRYGQIYEEVRALRKETRHSVKDLRERFKEKGVIQNKDQFIVRLIAQERNEQQGKVEAIKSLQQWRLTDIELHNFLNRCYKKGLAGKLELATQWVVEQEAAGGDVNFKEGLAFYSSIGILQPRSSAQTQQQWREWREWEDAMTCALENRKAPGKEPPGDVVDAAGPDASCNEDSTVCNSPWSSERGGGGGSFGGFNGSLRASSAHGEGDVAGGYGSARFRSRSGTASEDTKDLMRLSRTRGRTAANRDSPRQKRGWWSWRSYSPPSSITRQKSADSLRKLATEKKVTAPVGYPANNGSGGAPSPVPPLVPPRLDPPDDGGGGSEKPAESVVRASGGYLPPRHPLASQQLSPVSPPDGGALGAVDPAGGVDVGSDSAAPCGVGGAPVLSAAPGRGALKMRGAARTRAKGPADGGTPKPTVVLNDPAPTEEKPSKAAADLAMRRRRSGGDEQAVEARRSGSLSGVLSGLADWLMPGMEGGRGRHSRVESREELILEVYPRAPSTPEHRGGTKSAPATPRGRPKGTSVLREGGWFYNGDSDYTTEEEDGNFESEDDEGFWADAGTIQPPRKLGGGGGIGILDRLKRLFT